MAAFSIVDDIILYFVMDIVGIGPVLLACEVISFLNPYYATTSLQVVGTDVQALCLFH